MTFIALFIFFNCFAITIVLSSDIISELITNNIVRHLLFFDKTKNFFHKKQDIFSQIQRTHTQTHDFLLKRHVVLVNVIVVECIGATSAAHSSRRISFFAMKHRLRNVPRKKCGKRYEQLR